MYTVTIDGVTTGDVVPAVAPHRISNKATKNRANVVFTPWDDGLLPLDDATGLFPEDPGPFPSESLYPSEALYPESFGLLPDDQDAPVLAWTMRIGGTTPYTGTEVSYKGRVATQQLACSDNLAASELLTLDTTSPPNVQILEAVDYSELPSTADGSVTIQVWANFGGEWA